MSSNEGFPVQGPRPPFAAPGVPTPYSVHVHPYPTRYHGGIWTRPMFGLPYVRHVQSVFMPTNFWGCREPTAGLGALSYQTHRGVFGDDVRGGGVFGEELRGLGKEYEAPAFMPQVSTATAEPEQGTTSVPGLKSPDARVAELQGYLNRVLSAAGYALIGQDGKLGPATCGAIAWYEESGRALASGTTKVRIEENLGYAGHLYAADCNKRRPWKAPARPSAAPAVATPVAPMPAMPPPRRGPGAATVIGLVGVAALGTGAAVYWARKRKR